MRSTRATAWLLGGWVGVLALGGSVQAAFITDGSLSVNIDSSGRFNRIVLNGTTIDLKSTFQGYFANGMADFLDGTPVVVAGSSAFYTARTWNGLGVAATSRILGPLASNPTTTNVLEQVLTFTNGTNAPLPLGLMSLIDPDLRGTASGDIVAFDSARQGVSATDSPQLAAAIARSDTSGAFGWDVGPFGTVSTSFPAQNRSGPTGPGDVAMSIGFNLVPIGPGQSATVRFRYLFSTDLSSIPADFRFAASTPEPSAFILLGSGLALALVAGARLRRRR